MTSFALGRQRLRRCLGGGPRLRRPPPLPPSSSCVKLRPAFLSSRTERKICFASTSAVRQASRSHPRRRLALLRWLRLTFNFPLRKFPTASAPEINGQKSKRGRDEERQSGGNKPMGTKKPDHYAAEHQKGHPAMDRLCRRGS